MCTLAGHHQKKPFFFINNEIVYLWRKLIEISLLGPFPPLLSLFLIQPGHKQTFFFFFSSSFLATLITMLADHFHHTSLLSLQFPMDPFFTMLHDDCPHNAPWLCYHNAPGPVSSQHSIPLVITVHKETFHYNAPWHLSSQCSMAFIVTIFPGTFHHDVQWKLSSNCSMTIVITIVHTLVNTRLHNPCHHNTPWLLSSQ